MDKMQSQDKMINSGMEGIDPAQSQLPDSTGGYKICIQVSQDGQMSVGVEPAAMQGEYGDESAYQPVQGMQDLMTQIAAIVKSNGQVPDRTQEQAGFDQGFAAGA